MEKINERKGIFYEENDNILNNIIACKLVEKF
jgi:hypothetical protein